MILKAIFKLHLECNLLLFNNHYKYIFGVQIFEHFYFVFTDMIENKKKSYLKMILIKVAATSRPTNINKVRFLLILLFIFY